MTNHKKTDDCEKTREQLIRELEQTRQRTAALEASGTESQQTVEGLREKVQRMDLALKSSQTGTWSWDVPTNTAFWDDCIHPLFGLQPGTFSGSYQDFLDLVHPDDRNRVKRTVDRCVEEGAGYNTEYRVVWPDGSVHTIASQGEIYHGQQGRAVRMTGVCWDITQRKRAEEELQKSNALANAVIKGTTDAVFVKDPRGRYLMANATAARAMGKPIEEVIGKNDAALFRPEVARRIMADDREIMRSGEISTFEETTSSAAATITWHTTKGPYLDEAGRILGIVGISRNITQRKQAEEALRKAHDHLERRVEQRTSELAEANAVLEKEIGERKQTERALRESEGRWRSLVENMPDVIFIIDRGNNIQYVNQSPPEADAGELLGTTGFRHIQPEYHELIRQSHQRAFESRATQAYELVDIYGLRWSCRAVPMPADGVLQQLLVICTEVTARKKAEEELQASEERFRQLAENIDEVFWLGSPERDEIVYISPVYEKTWGRSCESLYQNPQSWMDAVVQEDRETLIADLDKKAAGDFSKPMFPAYRIIRPDGSIRWILSRSFPIRNERGEIYRVAGIAEDITEQKQAEQNLEAEGRLLREVLDLHERERKLIAHEIHDGFVQDVVGAKMVLEAALGGLQSQNSSAADQLQSVNSLLDRAIAEGRRMITELRPMIIDEQGVVAAIEHLIAQEYCDPSLRVEFSFSSKLDRLDSMLEGVVFRIVQEALTNVKRHSQCDSAVVQLTHDDRRLRIEIRDCGVGFDPDLVSRERFGLRGIRERVRLFHGHATIDSTPGNGTRVTVELPLTIGRNATSTPRGSEAP